MSDRQFRIAAQQAIETAEAEHIAYVTEGRTNLTEREILDHLGAIGGLREARGILDTTYEQMHG